MSTEKTLAAQIAAHTSWANTENRAARTFNARKALENKFLVEANGDPQRAEHLRKAYYARIALKSVQARRLKAQALRLENEVAEAEMNSLGMTA